MFALSAFHPFLLEGIHREDGLYTPVPGKLYIYFALFFGIVCGLAFYQCFIGYTKSTGARKNQIKYVNIDIIFFVSSYCDHHTKTKKTSVWFATLNVEERHVPPENLDLFPHAVPNVGGVAHHVDEVPEHSVQLLVGKVDLLLAGDELGRLRLVLKCNLKPIDL